MCHFCTIYSHQKLVIFRNIKVSQGTSLIEYSFWYSWMINGRPPATYCWIVDSWKEKRLHFLIYKIKFYVAIKILSKKWSFSGDRLLCTCAWPGSKIIEENAPKTKNPWCSHHTKTKAKLNDVNRFILHCQYNTALIYQSGKKFQGSIDKRASAGHQGKIPRLKYCVFCADFDTSLHLFLVFPLGGTAGMALRFPHHFHCTHFWVLLTKYGFPQWDFQCDTEITLLNGTDKMLSQTWKHCAWHRSPHMSIPSSSSLHFYILIRKLLGRMEKKAAESSGL